MATTSSKLNQTVYIIDGARSPFLKVRGTPGPFSASDIAVQTCRELLLRQSFDARAIGEVITGCMIPSEDEANIARLIALRLGCPQATPAWTVQRNCASGMQALDCAIKDIAMGRHELILAGGTETMSRSPLLFNQKMVLWFANMMSSKRLSQKLGLMLKLRPSYFKPVIALIHGLTDPLVNMMLGQTAEEIAYRFGISREQMDAFAVQSHKNLAAAVDDNYFADEIVSLYDHQGQVYGEDDGLRRDSSLQRLAKLKPYFDRKYGMVTAGNSAQVTDGAAFLILASQAAVDKYQLKPLAKIVDCPWSALDPAQMGLGPVYASSQLLNQQQLRADDIDYWEINEAFAAQVLACLAAWQDKDFCQQELGLSQTLNIDASRINIDGGAVAIGHPVGATGARIVLHMMNILRRKQAKRGIATLCIGGGQGGAMLIENLNGDKAIQEAE